MEGTKHDEGKLRWDLVPWDAFEEVVRVYTHGASKYGDNNWMGLEDAENRYFAALVRHLVAWRKDEHIGPTAVLNTWRKLPGMHSPYCGLRTGHECTTWDHSILHRNLHRVADVLA